MYYDDNGLVICQLCGKVYHFITPKHLSKSHEMTTKEYREKFPEAPMAKKGFYDTLKEKKETRKIMEKEIVLEPIIEELSNPTIDDLNESEEPINPTIENLDESFDSDSFKESESIVKLAERKVPVPEKSSDPMDDKMKIISYLKLSFPNIKNNYMFKKKKPDGTVECQFVTDMADPSFKIMFDFPKAFWHNEQIGISSHVRNQLLKSYGWKIITITASMPKVLHVESKLKNK